MRGIIGVSANPGPKGDQPTTTSNLHRQNAKCKMQHYWLLTTDYWLLTTEPMPSPLEIHFGRTRDLLAPLAQRIAVLHAARFRSGGLTELLRHPLEVLVPSRAFAESLTSALLEIRPEGLAGIEIRTPETLALRILNRAGKHPRVATPAEQLLAMRAAAAGTRGSLQGVEGAGALLLRTWRDVRDSDRTLEDLSRARREERSRIAPLAAAWQRYEEHLRAFGAIDPADLFRSAAAALQDEGRVEPQVVFGFYDATGVQQRFLFALHRAGGLDSFWIPVPRPRGEDDVYGYAHRFITSIERLGRASGEEPRSEEHAGAGGAPWDLIRHDTEIGEVRDVLARARTLVDAGVAANAIAIVARSLDDRIAAAVQREAAEWGLSVTPRRGRPLVSHPWGRAIRNLLRLRTERFRREIVIELAGAPFRRGSLPEGARASELDAAARRAEIAGGRAASIREILPHLDQQSRRTEGVRVYADVVESLERMSEGTDRSRRGAVWADWLDAVLGRLRIDCEPDVAALEALRAISELLRRADHLRTELSVDEIDALLVSAPDLPLPPSGLPQIWFGDLMGFRGRTFDHVFAVSLRQELIPQRRSDDVLLPDSVRTAIGVKEIGTGRPEEILLFRLLFDGSSKGLHLSWASSDGARTSWRPSIFLKQLALTEAADVEARRAILSRFDEWVANRAPGGARAVRAGAREAEDLAAGGPVAAPLARQLRSALGAGTRSPWDGYLQPDAAFDTVLRDRLLELSSGRIETFGTCPHRFYLQTLLGIEEVDEPEWELQITPRKKGTLDHTILERFYDGLAEDDIESMRGATRLSERLAARLDAILDAAFAEYEERYAVTSPLIRRVERRLTRSAIGRFLAADLADLLETGMRPWRFELVFGLEIDGVPPEYPPARIPVEGFDLRIRGRIDRVDRSPDGSRWRVVDYKSGKGDRFQKLGEQIARGHSLQIALYALAAIDLFGLHPSQVEAAIKPIRSEEKPEKFAVALADTESSLRETLHVFLDSMALGRFPAVVGNAKADHCRFCVVASWCRTRHTPEHAWATRRAGSALRLLSSPADEGSR